MTFLLNFKAMALKLLVEIWFQFMKSKLNIDEDMKASFIDMISIFKGRSCGYSLTCSEIAR